MTWNFKPLIFMTGLLTANVFSCGISHADPIRIASEYSISFAGIPVARSKFNTIIDGTSLSITGTLATAGLAAVFDSTKATSVSSGVITKSGIQSQSFRLDYKSGKRSRSTRVSFSDGNVADVTITPKAEPHPNSVPVEQGHLIGVVDPFFASLVFANTPEEVCNRTIQIFDGVLRINLVMRPSGNEPYVIKGLKGDGVRCAVRYQPVSGHRNKSNSVNYMSDGERASIVFAALPGTKLYGPVKAVIKTKNGSVTIRAVRFEQSAG